MKKIVSLAVITTVIVSLLMGTSPALAQKAPVFPNAVSANQSVTTTQTYSVTDRLMAELNKLMTMLREAQNKGDRELTQALEEKIRTIKEEISRTAAGTADTDTSRTTPNAVEEKTREQTTEARQTAGEKDGVSIVTTSRTSSCDELKAAEQKRMHYEELYNYSDDQLKAKGYRLGKEDIRNTIAEIDEYIQKLRLECEAGNTVRAREGTETETRSGGKSPPLISAKPVAAGSGDEIASYYKRRIAEIATQETDTDKKVAVLKDLKVEIDRLIEELVKGRDSINTREVSGLVNRIQVRPGEVKMDEVSVKTVDKSVVARINNTEVEIKPTKSRVIMNDGNLEITASELNMENDVLRVGNSEVRVVPSAAVERLKVEAKEIELTEENARAVYRIKADESRKLLGFIPVNMEGTYTVDAADANAEVISQKRPWWAFLTTK
ncbi:hypothetical protein ACFLUG_01205 [Chloroflexota bacterium]